MKTSTRFLFVTVMVIPIMAISLNGCSDITSESKPKAPPKEDQVQGPLDSGKVVNAMRGGGYTYIQVENHGEQFWIASSVINVQRNDIVAWENGSVMTNFTSYALNRKFEEIHFVRSITILR
ncbi:hypothetical protein [Kaarinaea lacus]